MAWKAIDSPDGLPGAVATLVYGGPPGVTLLYNLSSARSSMFTAMSTFLIVVYAMEAMGVAPGGWTLPWPGRTSSRAVPSFSRATSDPKIIIGTPRGAPGGLR